MTEKDSLIQKSYSLEELIRCALEYDNYGQNTFPESKYEGLVFIWTLLEEDSKFKSFSHNQQVSFLKALGFEYIDELY